MAIKVFSQLTQATVPLNTDLICIELAGGAYRHILKSDFMKSFDAIQYTETSNSISIASGTLTLDTDANGNSHDVTVTGAITMGQPSATLTGDEFISGSIEIHGWQTHTITWGGSDWDWGSAGEPATPTARMMLWYYRKAGDTKTLVSLGGAFS